MNMNQQANLFGKDVTYLHEAMAMESLACKKFEQYQHQLSDAQQKNIANQITQHHKENFNALFNYFNSHQ